MSFLTGVNYWASNAGVHTFSSFDEKVIDKDFSFLKSYGVDTIRVFPLWTEFQPIENSYANTKTFAVRKNGVPLERLKYKSGLSETACEKFSVLLSLAKKYNLKVIVSLITGWMSGKSFIPEAIRSENPITSKRAMLFECKFIKDFISVFKENKQIIAWEYGNECNVLSLNSDAIDNELWLQTISQAIKAEDSSRPLYAGMHGLTCNGKWDIQTVGNYSDVMTTHPYPLFTPYCSREEVTSMRASLHAVAESEYYSSIANKPCLVEEIGTLGPMIASGDKAGEYVEKAYATSIAGGTTGFLWWCAFDQDKLDFPPYDVFAVEQNLGIAYDNETPKKELIKLQEVKNFFSSYDNLSNPTKDISVILTSEQDDFKVAYGAYSLALQAGHLASFSFENQELKDAPFYVLPSITSITGIPKLLVSDLVQKVENGAKLLITYNGGYVSQFNRLTGLEVQGRTEKPKTFNVAVDGKKVELKTSASLILKPISAKVVIKDNEDIILTKNTFGKGEVYFLNAPLESLYTETFHPEDSNLYLIYNKVFGLAKGVNVLDKKVAVYNHLDKNLAVLINFNSEKTFDICIPKKVKNVKNAKIENGKITFEKDYAVIEYGE